MRCVWIGGIVFVVMTVAGCSTAGQSVSTTSNAHTKRTSVHTATTLGTSTSTPGPKDKSACSKFATYQLAAAAGKKPSSSSARRALSHAENPKLRRELGYWEHALIAKNASKVSHAQHRISAICDKIEKSAPRVMAP